MTKLNNIARTLTPALGNKVTLGALYRAVREEMTWGEFKAAVLASGQAAHCDLVDALTDGAKADVKGWAVTQMGVRLTMWRVA